MVTPDGQARAVARDLSFPNGAVFTPDGKTLIIAETFAYRLTAFDVAADGSLSGRRAWAALGDVMPDGICLDAEGAIWFGSPLTSQFVRVREGGEITDRIDCTQPAIACALGGADGRTLYLVSGPTTRPEEALAVRAGRIDSIRVAVAGADLA
jgi:sugar lactone lactonase YvrE